LEEGELKDFNHMGRSNGNDKYANVGVKFDRLQIVDPAKGGAGDYSKTIKMVYLKRSRLVPSKL
jgi:hypothetical protein